MAYSLFDLAKSIEARAARQRSRRRFTEVQHDPHLARDIGVPYRPRPPVRIDQW